MNHFQFHRKHVYSVDEHTPLLITLKKGEMWKSQHLFAGLFVGCTGGTVWITQTGHSEDVFLHQGDDFVTHEHGTVLVESVSDCAQVALVGA